MYALQGNTEGLAHIKQEPPVVGQKRQHPDVSGLSVVDMVSWPKVYSTECVLFIYCDCSIIIVWVFLS